MTRSTQTMTVDQRIESLLTDRKILLFRYDAHLRRKIWKKLTALQRQLLNRISAAGVEAIKPNALAQLLRELKHSINAHYADISAFSHDELAQLLPLEVKATTDLYNDAVRFDLFNTAPEITQQAVKSAQLIAGSPLEDWWKKQRNDLAFKFEGLIRQSLLEGKQTSQIITAVRELMDSRRRHAETLVRTAVMQIHSQAQAIVRDNNLDILKGEQQISTLDLRTSDVCRVRDGKAWDLDKKPIGDHDLPYQRPPLHPNCRSTMRLLTKSWRELGYDIDEIPESTRASMDGQVKQGLTYEDWLKGKTSEEQDAVLGKGKADLWRRGVITFRDMLDQSGRPLTLAQLQDWKEIPQAIRTVRCKRWSDEFKEKTENIYYTFANEGIIIDQHGLSRFGDRLAETGLSLNEAVKFVKETKPNYIDARNGRLVRFDSKKKVAVIQSAIDGQIISFFRKPKIEGKDEWKPI